MKYNYNYTENDYKTPPVLYNKALEYWGLDKFDCDVCCSDENIPAYQYFKIGEIDGLKAEWGKYNWCNPPFNECKKWIIKAHEEMNKGKRIAMLIPVRTETAYWHDYLLCVKGVDIEFLRKGYKFLDKNNNEMGIFKNALALVYFWKRGI